jgi:hypothetical protein
MEGKSLHGYILTVIDTFTRYVLPGKVGFSMRENQVKEIWNEIKESLKLILVKLNVLDLTV